MGTKKLAKSNTMRLPSGLGPLAGGLVFAMFLSGIGVLTHRHLLKFWRYAVVLAFIIAAILTPPDWVSQVLLAIPMVALYLLGVGVAFLFGAGRRDAKAKAKIGSDLV